jgi:hypothetical protein
MKRLSEEQLMDIRKRAEYAATLPFYASSVSEVIEDDVPELIAEIIRLRVHAHDILEHYDDAQRRVIDEVVGSGRELTLSFHEYLIKSWRDEINGVDKENGV